MTQPMPTDDIIDELRAFRAAFAARFDYDVAAMGRHLRERERASGHAVAQPPGSAAPASADTPPATSPA